MTQPLRLMALLAHPDDESLALGATLAKYAAAGVETYVITATLGERGWFGDSNKYPGPSALGQIRQRELAAAAQVLGLHEVSCLGYQDGEVDQADPQEAIGRIVHHLRRVRPQVVVTFDPYGAYGHPDHIAISQLTTAAVVAAAGRPAYETPYSPHQVAKLYFRTETEEKMAVYQEIFGELRMEIDGVERSACGWERWAITTVLDTEEYWQQTWQAIAQHRSQLPGYRALQEVPAAQHRYLWSTQTFYRVFSLVNGGRAIERDLFAGVEPAMDAHQIAYRTPTSAKREIEA